MNAFLALFDLIGELARRRHQMGKRGFAALGLTHTEARLLTLLGKEGGEAAQDALAERLFVDRTNAGRALQRLERGGYLLRRKSEADKRARLVETTAKGRRAVIEIARAREQMAERFFGELENREAEAVVGLLRKALANEEDKGRGPGPGGEAAGLPAATGGRRTARRSLR